jgi:agmatinase
MEDQSLTQTSLPPTTTPAVHNGSYFGFESSIEEAQVVFLPVPWDATTSYRPGTASGPEAILQASYQLEWFDEDVKNAWDIGHATAPLSPEIQALNQAARIAAEQVIQHQAQGGESDDPLIQAALNQVNQTSEKVNSWVYHQAQSLLSAGKLVGLVGGDHSSPYGYLQALAEITPSFGILQIDAHADLIEAYEGFAYSHASIMNNALKLPQVSHIVQVGVRAIDGYEKALAAQEDRVHMFTDRKLKAQSYKGTPWATQCAAIIDRLPEQVYVSFDIDGLNPVFCPHTGTPVPGGLEFSEAVFLLRKLQKSGRQIIGFDLCEVAPGSGDEWDGNVGARLLYKLANLMYASQPDD